ncbi:N-acetylmuramoyl-L-alanine amidase [Parasulfuritortus cantonensis]|uniref:N-acetylmuramoyl-L-alanine amidase n=1 Tax=Parasulfuritortus cantonensis TaxID=2528202 RepID=A0A4R1BKV9_9PROT|nr:N-acetylmuramoyl-L-alanine amidase [Parasulfuritortus cantonensis]TCJ17966.1 N-acetylmuramoyl-L-alanine amidase [Parasulfuritortus cantonensis]
MKIVNHRLVGDDGNPVAYVASPNRGVEMTPEYLIMHYTSGSTAEGAIAWLCNPAAKASAHLVIGRDGVATQLVPFNRVAWHAGQSQWAGRSGLNGFSIGIELDNAGHLERAGGRWVSAASKRVYADDDVLVANHKQDQPGTPPSGWHEYSEAQMAVAFEVGLALVAKYGLRDVLGHEDIAPRRKSDPGPAFPMASFRARLMGRADSALDVYETSVALNVRAGPGTEYMVLEGSPLPVAARVALLERQGVWWRVDVLDTVAGVMDMVGWCHSRYLVKV